MEGMHRIDDELHSCAKRVAKKTEMLLSAGHAQAAINVASCALGQCVPHTTHPSFAHWRNLENYDRGALDEKKCSTSFLLPG
jgi:hypothetical protein